eukprot:TRINITY_DN4862_c0_g1_i1.p2 TRINITY_DN4862_c0_g1~~TRINITY_DN4862_c0_g1_i1.p2  ORF type:complete len:121 (+),score=15.67 TRINITY_DN4862_c0_g1_i1:30-365(+)
MAYQPEYPVHVFNFPPEQHGPHNGPGGLHSEPLCSECDKTLIHFRLKAHQVTFTVDHCPKCERRVHPPPNAVNEHPFKDWAAHIAHPHSHGHHLHHGQPQAQWTPEGAKLV